MTEELKQAVRTIAEYDGKQCREYKGKMLVGREYRLSFAGGKDIQWDDERYHTSADALLDVWRKVMKERNSTTDLSVVWDSGMSNILHLIAHEQYSEACIQLAKIINQLKEEK